MDQSFISAMRRVVAACTQHPEEGTHRDYICMDCGSTLKVEQTDMRKKHPELKITDPEFWDYRAEAWLEDCLCATGHKQDCGIKQLQDLILAYDTFVEEEDTTLVPIDTSNQPPQHVGAIISHFLGAMYANHYQLKDRDGSDSLGLYRALELYKSFTGQAFEDHPGFGGGSIDWDEAEIMGLKGKTLTLKHCLPGDNS